MTGRHYWAKWLRWWRRTPQRRTPNDFADYGTAFGLDLSLEHERRQQAMTPTSTEPSPSPPQGH